jgi:hypothetical protein
MSDAEREHIVRALAETGWKVGGKGGAAELLGMKRTTLQSRMLKLGISLPHPQPKNRQPAGISAANGPLPPGHAS